MSATGQYIARPINWQIAPWFPQHTTTCAVLGGRCCDCVAVRPS